jgi:hypothetical protein
MPLTPLTYIDNNNEHRCVADTLGTTQGRIIKGVYTRNTTHAYYAGHELRDNGISWTGIYLKADCPGTGKTKYGRTQNRVIVAVTQEGDLVENWAVFWRHDDRLMTLDKGFFTRGKSMRDYILKL